MSLIALLLVMAAAVCHTAWNFLVKAVEGKPLLIWWALIVGSLLYLPLLAWGWPIPPRIWPYAIASALVEAAYFVALMHAYDRGDFSLVYPVARGGAPALLAVWAVLFLGEAPAPVGLLGVAVLALGLLAVGGGPWWTARPRAAVELRGIGAACGVAVCVSLYSAIDGAAVRLMAPAPYTVLVFALTLPCITPVVLARHGGRAIGAMWCGHWRRILGVAALMLLAYLLVLQAYALAPVSYVGALREVSIVFAAVLGWRWLKEGFGPLRTAGAVLIAAARE
jgi:drug/metabolite transporter (DMT)-like permease